MNTPANYPLHYILAPGNEIDAAISAHYTTGHGINWALIDQDYGINEAIRILRNEGSVDCSYFWEKLQKAERWAARGSRNVRRPSISGAVDTLRRYAHGIRGEGFTTEEEGYPALPISKVGRYTLSTEGARYIMRGAASGTHSLDIENTDADRLAAHWTGYTAAA